MSISQAEATPMQTVWLADTRCEVVYVMNGFRLLDSESYQRSYSRNDDKPLEPGFYFVCWAPDGKRGRFDGNAVFHGPFRRRQDAIGNMVRLKEQLQSMDTLLGQCARQGC